MSCRFPHNDKKYPSKESRLMGVFASYIFYGSEEEGMSLS